MSLYLLKRSTVWYRHWSPRSVPSKHQHSSSLCRHERDVRMTPTFRIVELLWLVVGSLLPSVWDRSGIASCTYDYKSSPEKFVLGRCTWFLGRAQSHIIRDSTSLLTKCIVNETNRFACCVRPSWCTGPLLQLVPTRIERATKYGCQCKSCKLWPFHLSHYYWRYSTFWIFIHTLLPFLCLLTSTAIEGPYVRH